MQGYKNLPSITVLFFGLFNVSSVLAQVPVPVVEAGEAQTQNQPATSNGQSEILVNMYLQLEALQAEIQNLRGTVDEQSYQIRRMQIEQRDRYLDTDSRLSEIYNQVQSFHSGQDIPVPLPVGGESSINENNTANNADETSLENQIVSTNQSSASAGAAVGITTPQNEQELYRQALNLLLEDEAYQESITLFQQYMDVYTQGRYFTNALYWQGAALELVGNYNQAIVVLQRLINEFPEDPKAPTAMLRLGTVYREMGDISQARTSWQGIRSLYPDSTSEIEIATEYLSEISN